MTECSLALMRQNRVSCCKMVRDLVLSFPFVVLCVAQRRPFSRHPLFLLKLLLTPFHPQNTTNTHTFSITSTVKCNGTEDRVKDPSKQVPPNDQVIPFVSFPGAEIKDLYVIDETTAPAPSAPAAKPATSKPQPAQQKQQQASAATGGRQPQGAQSKPKETATTSSVGTGAHLQNLRVKTATGVASGDGEKVGSGVFDFEQGLAGFNKTEVMASVATDLTIKKETVYKKDDFFDSLSRDMLDRAEGRKTRHTAAEERNLNQDTFGAVALQQSRYGGRGRGRGRGGGGGGRGGRGGGRRPRGNGGSYVPSTITA